MRKNFTLSLSLIALVTIVALFPMSGCKKDTTPAPGPKSIEGLWIGTIANATSGPQFYSLSIKPDGKLTFDGMGGNQQHLGIGTWTLTGTTFTASVTTVYGLSSNIGVKQTLTAVFNSSTGTLSSGTWQNTSTVTDSGTFAVTKVN